MLDINNKKKKEPEKYKNKPTIANPDEPFGYRYIAKKRLLAILSKRMEDEKDE